MSIRLENKLFSQSTCSDPKLSFRLKQSRCCLVTCLRTLKTMHWTQRCDCGGMVFVRLAWSNRFLRSTAPDSLGAVLAASTTKTNLVVLQFLGTIIIMTVLIMEPVSLELNKIGTSHNLATDLAQTPIAHRTAAYVYLMLCLSL